MLTDFVRDQAFTTAWFGLMAVVWFGWSQEDPPAPWRWRLGVGSILGLLLFAGFMFAVIAQWGTGSALEAHFHWFGILVGAEVVAAGLGAFVLIRRGRAQLVAWWVALVVALHFLPLAALLGDWSIAVVGLVQLVALALVLPRVRRANFSSSRYVGPLMGSTLLLASLIAATAFISRYGLPWLV